MTQLPPGVVEALRKGNKIEAIKLLRAVSKVGLAEAKTVIDALERHGAQKGGHQAGHSEHHPRVPPTPPPVIPGSQPGLSPGEVPRTPGEFGFVILVIVAAAVAWLFWK